jgi:uncharacterized Zn finger protein
MLINYVCNTCQNNISKIILRLEDVKGVIPCGSCGGFLERIISGPTSNAVEIIDNGFMPRTVEYDTNRADLRKDAADDFLKKFKKEE